MPSLQARIRERAENEDENKKEVLDGWFSIARTRTTSRDLKDFLLNYP
jgi:hypothetical protein